MNKNQIIAAASDAIFGKPLVTNNYRSVLVEAMVAAALPDWEWCSADYAACDFKHGDGTRLEVKQSALKQSWASKTPPRPSWDIKARTGYWENGTDWVSQPGRNADIYVFALHAITYESADHRDPSQWHFYVVPTVDLPGTQRIGLPALERLVSMVDMSGLARAVGAAAA